MLVIPHYNFKKDILQVIATKIKKTISEKNCDTKLHIIIDKIIDET